MLHIECSSVSKELLLSKRSELFQHRSRRRTFFLTAVSHSTYSYEAKQRKQQMATKSEEKNKKIAGEISILTQMIQAEKDKKVKIKSAQAPASCSSKK